MYGFVFDVHVRFVYSAVVGKYILRANDDINIL